MSSSTKISHRSKATSSQPQMQEANEARRKHITNFQDGLKKMANVVLWGLGRFCDNVILLQMGQTYKARFREFANDGDIADWRKEQQAEWDRLSNTLALLSVMHIAALAITPRPPELTTAVWLGGAGLSTCAVFIVQYFPVKAFNITDEDMQELVKEGNPHIGTAILASIVAAPIVAALWSTVLLFIGLICYAIRTELGPIYRIIALIPICSGLVVASLALYMGERLGASIDTRYQRDKRPESPV